MCCDCAVSSLPFNLGLSNRDQEIFIHNSSINVELDTVHHLVLKEDYGIVITDG